MFGILVVCFLTCDKLLSEQPFFLLHLKYLDTVG